MQVLSKTTRRQQRFAQLSFGVEDILHHGIRLRRIPHPQHLNVFLRENGANRHELRRIALRAERSEQLSQSWNLRLVEFPLLETRKSASHISCEENSGVDEALQRGQSSAETAFLEEIVVQKQQRIADSRQHLVDVIVEIVRARLRLQLPLPVTFAPRPHQKPLQKRQKTAALVFFRAVLQPLHAAPRLLLQFPHRHRLHPRFALSPALCAHLLEKSSSPRTDSKHRTTARSSEPSESASYCGRLRTHSSTIRLASVSSSRNHGFHGFDDLGEVGEVDKFDRFGGATKRRQRRKAWKSAQWIRFMTERRSRE